MDSAPLYFDVTDDGLDAPDGAVVFVEQYGAKYERVGGTWRLAPESQLCRLCERYGPDLRMEEHHLQTRRKSKEAVELICQECHKTIHGLFTQRELRDSRLGLDTVEGLLGNDRFLKALGHIKKLAPGVKLKMRQAKSRRAMR